MNDLDELIARAELMLAENQWTSGWGVEALAEELCDALVSVRADRDAALARIAELEKSRDRWEELCGKIASEKYDLNARIAEAAKLHQCFIAPNGFRWCSGCSTDEYPEDWPCPTAVALGLDEGENENE